MPNPWDRGSAVMLESLGFEALATTSSGFAATLGRLDGRVTRDEAIAHARRGGRGGQRAGVGRPRELLRGRARGRGRDGAAGRGGRAGGLLGGGLQRTGAATRSTTPGLAAERVPRPPRRPRTRRRAASCSRPAPRTTCTAATTWPTRSRGSRATRRPAPTCCSRPVCASSSDIREVIGAVDLPVNVLVLPGMPSVSELADAGVSRISVGGAFAFAALGAAAEAARELLTKTAPTATGRQPRRGQKRPARPLAAEPVIGGRR